MGETAEILGFSFCNIDALSSVYEISMLTIPRKELVSAHIAVNLLDNVCRFPVSSLVSWLDSSVALNWVPGRGEYKLFVANRVNKILEHEDVTWRHVHSKENPGYITSRGG